MKSPEQYNGIESQKTYNTPDGKEFKVDEPSVLNPDDIEDGDRVFVKTESNRYMIRHSKSAGGTLKIYNEKADGFKFGYPLYHKGQPIAEIDKKFDFAVITDTEKNLGREYHATTVVGIEIKRGLDEYVESDYFQNLKKEKLKKLEETETFEDTVKKFNRGIRNGTIDDL